MKNKGSELKMINGFVHFYNRVPKEKRGKRRIFIILKKKLNRNVINWETIDENLIRVNLNWIQRKITIIEVYIPFEDEKVNIK